MTLDQLLGHRRVAIGDGGLATMLQAEGLPLYRAPEPWNLERPEAVTALHRAYAAAGAQWVQTNTFGGNGPRLAHCGLERAVERVNREAVLCARAAGEGLIVLASVGPTTAPADAWEVVYAAQCAALGQAGIDGVMVETIVSLAEGTAAIRAAARISRLVIASYTPGADGNLLDGTAAETAAHAFVAAGAVVVGVNCGSGPAALLPAAARLVAAEAAPVFAAPNAGLPEI
ncbi:MAG: metH, partial [Armatimonadetes bacterium]|nr:metH [Armatimonadota bacterium]